MLGMEKLMLFFSSKGRQRRHLAAACLYVLQQKTVSCETDSTFVDSYLTDEEVHV